MGFEIQARGIQNWSRFETTMGCTFLFLSCLPFFSTPNGNLAIPEDLPEDARKCLDVAVKAFHAAESSATDRVKLMDKAISQLKNAGIKAPMSPLPHYYLGIVYQWKRSYPDAKRALEKAVKLNPEFHEAYLELADVHVWQMDLKGSLAVYDRALGLLPEYVQAMDQKTMALIRLGDLKEARALLARAQELAPHKQREKMASRLGDEIRGPKWKQTFTCESENYRVMTGVSQELAGEIARSIELIRRAYNKVFDDIPKPERKYPVLVYESQYAYKMGGAPEESAGYYDPFFRKLVLYQAEEKKQTQKTLYHEAFHQFLSDYIPNAPRWFDEGLGEYFGSFKYVRKGKKEYMVCRPDEGHLLNIQNAIDEKLCPSVAKLMTMSRDQMYAQGKQGMHYAQAWSLMYYMCEGKRQDYRSLLVGYYRALRKGLDTEEAFKTTFGKINMDRFEVDWKTYIKGLPADAGSEGE